MATSDESKTSSMSSRGVSGGMRVGYGLSGIVLFLVAVVGFGLGLFTWIGGGSLLLIVYDLASSLAAFGLGYLFLLASADRRRLLR